MHRKQEPSRKKEPSRSELKLEIELVLEFGRWIINSLDYGIANLK